MNVSDTLNKAADLIQERGWVGTGGKGWEANEGTPLCIEGAIQAALGMPGGIAVTQVNTCSAGSAVREYLELGEFEWHKTDALFMWNDRARYVDGELTSVRTAEEVIEVLRATAVIEAARESELAGAR